MNIENGDILIANNGQVFRILIDNTKLFQISDDYIEAIGIVEDKPQEVCLLRKNLDSYRNITKELKLINTVYKKYFNNDFLVELKGKTIKLDIESALKKLEELKSVFNKEKEIEIKC